jgi:hypothetical protein
MYQNLKFSLFFLCLSIITGGVLGCRKQGVRHSSSMEAGGWSRERDLRTHLHCAVDMSWRLPRTDSSL